MSEIVPDKTPIELRQMGEMICRGRDWRWVALWAYNVHRLLRPGMINRDVWDDLDKLIQTEWDWHLGRELFDRLRELALAHEKAETNLAERAYLRLGEIAAKSISNASWYPGLFDLNSAWRVPELAFEIVRHLGDEKQKDFLQQHFKSLALNRYSDRPSKG